MTAAKAHVADLFAAELATEDMNLPAAHDDLPHGTAYDGSGCGVL